MELSSIRYNPSQYFLSEWSLIKVTGIDRESFFQGQVTSDLSKLTVNQAQLTARLNRTGKMQSFFYIGKLENYLFLLCPQQLASAIKEDFEKFIIMDDVLLENQDSKMWIQFNSFLNSMTFNGDYLDFNFYGLNARLVFKDEPTLQNTDPLELEKIRILNGWPVWGRDVDNNNFINDCYLNEIAISYKKGCFLGQETVAKIENNRGAAYYPVLLKTSSRIDLKNFLMKDFLIGSSLENKKAGTLLYQTENFLQVLLFRDLRVVGSVVELKFGEEIIKGEVLALPFYKNFSKEEIALELYYKGVEVFQNNNLNLAMEFIKKALVFDGTLADGYETLGVMLGRIEKFEEAISWMDKLLLVNPKSVMAHTNKSLFLMKLGKIEEAENEKSLATVKSFASFGQEAQLKKQLKEIEEMEKAELLRREKMFQQVLEIDEEDTIALFGMADILYHRKNFEQSALNLEKVLTVDPKYSTAYLLLGKAYEALFKIDKATNTYQTGIKVASKRGDMMPANEMQSRLNKLIVGPSLI